MRCELARYIAFSCQYTQVFITANDNAIWHEYEIPDTHTTKVASTEEKSYTICMFNGGFADPNMAKNVSADNGECCLTSYDYLLLSLETIKSIIQLHIVYCMLYIAHT